MSKAIAVQQVSCSKEVDICNRYEWSDKGKSGFHPDYI